MEAVVTESFGRNVKIVRHRPNASQDRAPDSALDVSLTHADSTVGQTGAWDRTGASLNLYEVGIHDLHSCVYLQVLLGLEFEPKIRMDGEW